MARQGRHHQAGAGASEEPQGHGDRELRGWERQPMIMGSNGVKGGEVPREAAGTCFEVGSAGRSPTAAADPSSTAGSSRGCRSNSIAPGSCADGPAAQAWPERGRLLQPPAEPAPPGWGRWAGAGQFSQPRACGGGSDEAAPMAHGNQYHQRCP